MSWCRLYAELLPEKNSSLLGIEGDNSRKLMSWPKGAYRNVVVSCVLPYRPSKVSLPSLYKYLLQQQAFDLEVRPVPRQANEDSSQSGTQLAVVEFCLPAGSFATALLREMLANNDVI
jgi:tRNA(Glu) U13 pseudouridine synthase TruD